MTLRSYAPPSIPALRRMIATAALSICSMAMVVHAQWTPLTTGVTSFRSITADGGALYAATYPAGVRKSINGGATWNQVNTGLPQSGANFYVESVGYNGNYVFAGTQSGIYRTNDGGASWTVANGTLTASNTIYANKFFVFGGVTMAVFSGDIAGGGGIWRTGNSGLTWTIGHSGMGSNARVYHMAEQGAFLYAASNVGLYISNDNGLSWQLSTVMNYSCYAIASINNTLVATTTFGYQYSTNNGGSWTNGTGAPANPTSGELIPFDGKVYAIAGSSGSLVSANNGATWATADAGLSQTDSVSLSEFFVNGSILYVGALFNVYSRTGSGTGLVQEAAAADAIIRPTLFSEGFVVEGMVGGGGTLELVDLHGRIVLAQTVNGNSARVERGALAAGTYAVMLRKANDHTFIGRVVAQ